MQTLGTWVGYKIGGGDTKCSKDAAITFCTVGYLLENLSHNPKTLRRYSHIVLDEVAPARLPILLQPCDCISASRLPESE